MNCALIRHDLGQLLVAQVLLLATLYYLFLSIVCFVRPFFLLLFFFSRQKSDFVRNALLASCVFVLLGRDGRTRQGRPG